MEIKYLIGGTLAFIFSIVIFIYALRVQEKKIAFLTIPFMIILAWYVVVYAVQPQVKNIWLDLTIIKCTFAIISSIYIVGYALITKRIYSLFIGVCGILLMIGVSWYLYLYLYDL